jgi:hypothetical protein
MTSGLNPIKGFRSVSHQHTTLILSKCFFYNHYYQPKSWKIFILNCFYSKKDKKLNLYLVAIFTYWLNFFQLLLNGKLFYLFILFRTNSYYFNWTEINLVDFQIEISILARPEKFNYYLNGS